MRIVGLRETAFRIRQQAVILGERLRGRPRRVRPSVAERPMLRFASNPAAAADWITRNAPDSRERILARAGRALAGEFDLLGYQRLRCGSPPDWHTDPVAGRTAPSLHWSRIPYLNPEVVGDHKVVWELNRHGYLLTLAQGYLLSRDEAFVERIDLDLSDWLEQNPPSWGINWCSSLEVAFRAIAWTWLLHLIWEAPALSHGTRARAMGSLRAHGRHIERHLSIYFSPNTHLTGEALGLLYLGVAFPGIPEAGRWRRRGWRILLDELPREVRPDGTYFEQSSWYQAYTVEFYLHAIMLARSMGWTVEDWVVDRVRAAVGVLRSLIRPDGTLPLLGDDDGGRLLVPAEGPCDFRDVLILAGLVLDQPDLEAASSEAAPGAVWLHRGATPDVSVPMVQAGGSFGHPDGGWFSMRDVSATGPGVLVVAAGSSNPPRGAHLHADPLSLDLWIGGTSCITDPGTYTYTGSERQSFRGTAAHATVSIEGRDTAESAGPFKWVRPARTSLTRWISTAGFAYLDASHDGYRDRGVAVRRTVLWHPGRYWLVVDRLRTSEAASAVVHWPLGPNVTTRREDGGHRAVLLGQDGATLATLVNPQDRPFEWGTGWSSPCYGVRLPVVRLGTSLRSEPPEIAHLTIIVPGDAPAFDLTATSCAGDGRHRWSWSCADGEHVLALSPGELLGEEAGDAELVWGLRVGGEWSELLCVGGTYRSLGGCRRLVRGDWSWARRQGSSWSIEEE